MSSCPNGWFNDTNTSECKQCSSVDPNFCSKCTGLATKCTSCMDSPDSTKVLYIDKVNYACVYNCPAGYYGDSTYKVCALCYERCETCSGNKIY